MLVVEPNDEIGEFLVANQIEQRAGFGRIERVEDRLSVFVIDAIGKQNGTVAVARGYGLAQPGDGAFRSKLDIVRLWPGIQMSDPGSDQDDARCALRSAGRSQRLLPCGAGILSRLCC